MRAERVFSPQFIEAPPTGEVGGARLRVARFDPEPQTSPRGVCVLLNGQTEFIEKYFEVIDELRARGYAVATMDWRGQGGSTRALANPLKGHVGDYSEHDADLAALMDQLVAPMVGEGPAPIVLAHSMGGHILLRYLHDAPGRLEAAVMCAPMIEIATIPGFVLEGLADVMSRIEPTGWIWGTASRDPLTRSFAGQIVTHDRARFQRSQDYLRAHPDLRLAGPTWSWLAATMRSTSEIEAAGYPEAIATPALVCGAGADRVVRCEATRAYVARMPHGEYVEIPGAGHEILMETDPIRAQFWSAFDGFISRHRA